MDYVPPIKSSLLNGSLNIDSLNQTIMYNAALLKAIIENVVDGILVIDKDGIIQLVNPSACSLFGYTTKELYGQNISMLMPAPYKDQHDNYIKRYEQTGRAHIIGIGREVTGLKKNGETFPLRLAVSEAKYAGESVYAGVLHDLSEEKMAAEKLVQHANDLEAVVEDRTNFLKNIVQTLEQAKEEVNISLIKEKEINQLKTRFVSMASHEFRTPLSSIQLSASLIEHYFDQLNKKKIFEHLDKIKSGVNNLTNIINDFLSVERIDAGKIKPVLKEFDLKMLCEDIVESMKLQAKRGQKIIYRHTGKITKVNLDSNLLQNCLLNFISNAIKYSNEDSRVELKTKIDENTCRIIIKDNGIGIPKEEQIHLFEPFFRANNTTDIEGTGLGLSIVKRYTELMGGTLKFKSQENSGSVFTLTFPVKT